MAESLEDKLTKIERGEQELLRMFQRSVQPTGGMHMSDFLMIGAAKRTVAYADAFRMLIKARNFTAAAPFVRLQLDTAMRMFAGTLVSNSEQYAEAVFKGDAVNKMKDRDGDKMTDAYLAKKLTEVYPWVEPVYKATCEQVHFSSRHIFASTSKLNDETRTVHFEVSARDPTRPDSDYFEVVEGFYAAMRATGIVCAGWQEAKSMRRQLRAAATENAAATATPAE